MSIPLICLLLFAAHTLLVVVVGIGTPRVSRVLSGAARPGDFPADTPHGGERYRRTMRAHANCVENLPVFASVVLTGAVAGASSGTLDVLAMVYLGARVCQTIAHVASGRGLVVNIRFTFFLVQIVCVVWMGILVALHLTRG
ncbi:MAG: MAPEG family protein [Sandaracinaceae bacterium]|nr:MAPEG family protein [Sandaracinaceae bacterium]